MFVIVSGENHGSGEAAAAGYFLCQRAGKQRFPVQTEGEEGLPV